MNHLWVYVLCNLVGVSLVLSLFLGVRKGSLMQQPERKELL